MQTQQLSPYDNAKYWIAQYESVDDVKDYMDKAAAVEQYAKRANDMEMEVKAAKARIRAERRMGQLLSDMDMAKGVTMAGSSDGLNPRWSSESTAEESPKTLSELGVTKNQSSRAQKLANVPEEKFEEALEADEAPKVGRIISSNKKDDDDGAVIQPVRRAASIQTVSKAEAKRLNDAIQFVASFGSKSVEQACKQFADNQREQVSESLRYAIPVLNSIKQTLSE